MSPLRSTKGAGCCEQSGQTCVVIDPRFVYLAAALSIFGAWGYLRDTLRGDTSPHRVTWALWGVEGVLAFAVEIQQHVGRASIMTLMLGLVPIVIVVASFRSPHNGWKISAFDLFCGSISVAGLAFWSVVHQPTVALASFVVADQVAALPTFRKSWIAPRTESPRLFFLGSLNCAITLLTLKSLTTAGVLFPGCIMVADLLLGLLIVSSAGPRFRGDTRRTSPAKMA